MIIRKPMVEELGQTNAVIMRSKAHWGYDEAFMEICREELMLSPLRLMSGNLRVLEHNGEVVGTVELFIDGETAELHKLFVEPSLIGTGAGRMLYTWAVERARQFGARNILIEADPDACGFYQKMGAKIISKVPSGSIAGRFLPLLRHDL